MEIDLVQQKIPLSPPLNWTSINRTSKKLHEYLVTYFLTSWRDPVARQGDLNRVVGSPFVRALAYGVCHEAVKAKACRSNDPTASR
jgi:hypothetical protein